MSKELLIEQSSSRFPGNKEYVFKHALVRDVAYKALLEDDRTKLHARAGRFLAEVGEDDATVAGQLDNGDEHELAASWQRPQPYEWDRKVD